MFKWTHPQLCTSHNLTVCGMASQQQQGIDSDPSPSSSTFPYPSSFPTSSFTFLSSFSTSYVIIPHFHRLPLPIILPEVKTYMLPLALAILKTCVLSFATFDGNLTKCVKACLCQLHTNGWLCNYNSKSNYKTFCNINFIYRSVLPLFYPYNFKNMGKFLTGLTKYYTVNLIKVCHFALVYIPFPQSIKN